jgi:hypothetical protein
VDPLVRLVEVVGTAVLRPAVAIPPAAVARPVVVAIPQEAEAVVRPAAVIHLVAVVRLAVVIPQEAVVRPAAAVVILRVPRLQVATVPPVTARPVNPALRRPDMVRHKRATVGTRRRDLPALRRQPKRAKHCSGSALVAAGCFCSAQQAASPVTCT